MHTHIHVYTQSLAKVQAAVEQSKRNSPEVKRAILSDTRRKANLHSANQYHPNGVHVHENSDSDNNRNHHDGSIKENRGNNGGFFGGFFARNTNNTSKNSAHDNESLHAETGAGVDAYYDTEESRYVKHAKLRKLRYTYGPCFGTCCSRCVSRVVRMSMRDMLTILIIIIGGVTLRNIMTLTEFDAAWDRAGPLTMVKRFAAKYRAVISPAKPVKLPAPPAPRKPSAIKVRHSMYVCFMHVCRVDVAFCDWEALCN